VDHESVVRTAPLVVDLRGTTRALRLETVRQL
jgi:hypothetical protein